MYFLGRLVVAALYGKHRRTSRLLPEGIYGVLIGKRLSKIFECGRALLRSKVIDVRDLRVRNQISIDKLQRVDLNELVIHRVYVYRHIISRRRTNRLRSVGLSYACGKNGDIAKNARIRCRTAVTEAARTAGIA